MSSESPRELAERFVKEELQFLPSRDIIAEWLWEQEYDLGKSDIDVPDDLVDSVTEIAERVTTGLSRMI